MLGSALALPLPAGATSVTGVCPDGSIFIVQRAESIPCDEAKVVKANEVPPLRPEFLPRPYGWEVFNRRNDPNNPYNLVVGEPIAPTPEILPSVSAPPPTVNTAPAPVETRVASRESFRSDPQQVDLALTDVEIRDLAMIVELSQQRAPAAIVARESDGRVRLARSISFERRLHERFAAAGRAAGSVLLFTASGMPDAALHANLTFTQGHMAFHPATDDPAQLGILRADDPVLGYVVLPETLDVGQPMDIYWDDRQITATLQP